MPKRIDDLMEQITYDADRPTPTESTAKFIAQCTAIVVCVCLMAASIMGAVGLGLWIF